MYVVFLKILLFLSNVWTFSLCYKGVKYFYFMNIAEEMTYIHYVLNLHSSSVDFISYSYFYCFYIVLLSAQFYFYNRDFNIIIIIIHRKREI